MKTRVCLFVALISLSAVCACVSAGGATEPPPTVASVDLARYAGLWYQVARYPHFF